MNQITMLRWVAFARTCVGNLWRAAGDRFKVGLIVFGNPGVRAGGIFNNSSGCFQEDGHNTSQPEAC